MRTLQLLLIFCGEKFLPFSWIGSSPQKLSHEYLLSIVLKIDSVTGNCESFSGNEDKDVKLQNIFITKQSTEYTAYFYFT